MNVKNDEKGSILCTYLYTPSNSITENLDNERRMICDLQALAEQWKEKGYISRYSIIDDELISTKLLKEAKQEV